MRRIALSVLLVALATPTMLAQDQPLLANNPTLSRTHIAFFCASIFSMSFFALPFPGSSSTAFR